MTTMTTEQLGMNNSVDDKLDVLLIGAGHRPVSIAIFELGPAKDGAVHSLRAPEMRTSFSMTGPVAS